MVGLSGLETKEVLKMTIFKISTFALSGLALFILLFSAFTRLTDRREHFNPKVFIYGNMVIAVALFWNAMSALSIGQYIEAFISFALGLYSVYEYFRLKNNLSQ